METAHTLTDGKLPGTGFSREDLLRDTIVGRRTLEGLVGPSGFTIEQLRRDTYVVTEESFPYMVSLERLLLEA